MVISRRARDGAARRAGTASGGRGASEAGSASGPRCPGGPPRARWAAAGANTSRPSKVRPSRTVPADPGVGPGPGPGQHDDPGRHRPGRRPPGPTGRCPAPPAMSVRRPVSTPPVHDGDSHRPAVVPTPGSTTASTTPGPRWGRHRTSMAAPAPTAKGGTPWERSMTGQPGAVPVEHGVDHTDELVGRAVVGEEEDGRHRCGQWPAAPSRHDGSRVRQPVTGPAASIARWPPPPPR